MKRAFAVLLAVLMIFAVVPHTQVSAVAAQKSKAVSGAAIAVTGPAIRYAKVKIKNKKISLYPDETARIRIRWTKGRKSGLTYSVADEKIAKVSKHGNIRAVYPGKTTVTVTTAKGSSSRATITVKRPDRKKVVYFTFDDGPGSKVTPQLLAVLKRNNVKATFFIVGTQAKGHEDILRQIVKDGHTLAIHTYTHDFRKIYASKKAYLDDFHKTEKLIKDATGVQPRYFRFPGGGNNHYMSASLRNEILTELHKEGYKEMDWNCGTADAASTYYSRDQLIRYGETTHWGSDPIVLLQHDWNAKYHTPEVTDALIRYYRAKGYSFDNLDHYYGPEMCFKRR